MLPYLPTSGSRQNDWRLSRAEGRWAQAQSSFASDEKCRLVIRVAIGAEHPVTKAGRADEVRRVVQREQVARSAVVDDAPFTAAFADARVARCMDRTPKAIT